MQKLEEMLWKNDVNLKDNGEDGSQRMTYNCIVICCGNGFTPIFAPCKPTCYIGCR